MNRHDYQKAFERITAELNPQQRKAIDKIDGPALVIAGPGTGKTHLLAARIGRILQESDVGAHNILCLTFTDAAVKAMRQRLVRYIGPEAHRLHIHTFHALCGVVIQENAAYFGKSDLEPLSELERIETVRKMIDNLPPSSALRRLQSLPYMYEKHLINLFSTMKTEAWTTEMLHKAIDVFLENLPQNPDYLYKINTAKGKKGTLKPAAVEQAEEDCRRLREAVDLYAVYTQSLFDAGRYDFEDMLLWVRAAFEQYPRILRRYQEQYLYILVDEFQDTNGIQNELLSLLANYWDTPNLFVVGDDDQAIYEFQGARLRNIEDFVAQYADQIQTIVLEDNYRSTAPILAAAQTLISFNTLRLSTQLGIEKKLLAHAPFVEQPVRIRAYPNALQEQADLLQQIIALRDQGVPLKEIGVIYSRHSEAEQLMNWLQKAKIPYEARRSTNFFDTTTMQQIDTILSYLQAEHRAPSSGDAFLYEILYFHFCNIDLIDIAKIVVQKPFLTAEEASEPIGLHEKIAIYTVKPSFLAQASPDRINALKHLLAWTTDLRKLYNNAPLPLLVEQMLTRTGLLVWINEQPNRLDLLQIIQTLVDWVATEAYKNPRITLADLHRQMAAMRDARVAMPLVKTYYATDALTLTTAHSAKGLEFEYVFMFNCLANTWDEKATNRRNQFWLPDTLTLTNITESEVEAARRLFFVGMTRAKASLQISYSKYTPDGKREQKRARFIDETLTTAAENIDFAEKTLEEAELVPLQLTLLHETPSVTVSPVLNAEEIDGILQQYALSPSALNRYLQCPLSFYYENILKVPTSTNGALAYGVSVHYALRRLYDRMATQKTPKMPSSLVFLKDFEHELSRWKTRLSPEMYAQKLAQGKLYLPDYYAQRAPHWSKKANVERTLKGVVWQGIPMLGAIDKMENSTNFQDYFDITDFKTGNPDNLAIDYNAPTESPIWRQMAFYKILIENYRGYNWVVENATIDCVTPDKTGVFRREQFGFVADDMLLFKETIKTVWAKITAHDFYIGCGKKDCTWCSFTQRYQNTAALGDMINAEMDDI